MVKRRFFLQGMMTMGVLSLLGGCSSTGNSLEISVLSGSLSPQLLGLFQRQNKKKGKVSFKVIPQFSLVKEMLEGKNNKGKSALVSFGEGWLDRAIANNLLDTFETKNLPSWDLLPPKIQQVMTRNQQGLVNIDGQVFGLPYRLGCTVIAYREDLLKAENIPFPKGWADLWNPQLKDRLSLLNHHREVVGLTLNKLGYSYNTSNLKTVNNLSQELKNLHRNVKFYDSKNYLQPLILGDTWVTVGWSHDIRSIQNQYPNIKTIIPETGTALWTDIWVKPKLETSLSPEANEQLSQWVEFCWSEKARQEISLFTNAISPFLMTTPINQLNPDLLPWRLSDAVFDRSEFITPLPKEISKEYEDYYRSMRES